MRHSFTLSFPPAQAVKWVCMPSSNFFSLAQPTPFSPIKSRALFRFTYACAFRSEQVQASSRRCICCKPSSQRP